ncbi:conserved hypothetical protein [Pediculus humanus corporis]|uniref:tRNA wybutosine-synthesizing protein 3 homolog n=1 Tax=Pediculus humanus subsp. corporis TaxID=121224 RepID=E0VRP2_PEDHC|nr:uncharacterized protein Phum_PHUM400440 [Pediculus humanus corporis]EEB16048.1 conserved hypothetical protein [Pediculus humanus corporis]
MDFKNVKKQILQASDLSKKGSVDESIKDLVDFINEQDDYVTTSSCSGRAILFTSSYGDVTGHKKSKKDCKWLYTSHDLIDPDTFVNSVNLTEGDLQFKFEPFILHILCSNLEKARHLHTYAIGAGFRDSGLTVGKHGKITLAIRSNLRLEVPLSQGNVMLVSNFVILKFFSRTS